MWLETSTCTFLDTASAVVLNFIFQILHSGTVCLIGILSKPFIGAYEPDTSLFGHPFWLSQLFQIFGFNAREMLEYMSYFSCRLLALTVNHNVHCWIKRCQQCLKSCHSYSTHCFMLGSGRYFYNSNNCTSKICLHYMDVRLLSPARDNENWSWYSSL